MSLSVFLRFSTSPGQEILISGDLVSSLTVGEHSSLPMTYLNKDLWYIVLNLEKNRLKSLRNTNYFFAIRQNDDTTIYDCGKHRRIDLRTMDGDLTIVDTWNEMGTIANIFNTAPFNNVFFRNKKIHSIAPFNKHFYFTVEAPTLNDGEKLIMTGNSLLLGNWLSSGYLEMKFDGKKWFAELESTMDEDPLEYKYCVISDGPDSIKYENGLNRTLPGLHQYQTKTIINDGYVKIENFSWRGTGVSIPVFSLRSKQSLGVGDFNDLKKMIDWCNKISVKMIQLLPVNDTTITHTWKDSYPYSSVSSIALHPLYISIEKVAGKSNIKLVESLIAEGKKFNAYAQIDYEAVMNIKWKSLRLLYDAMYESVSIDQDFKKFFTKNEHWLVSYAVFSYLRDKYKTAEYSKWEDHAIFTPQFLKEIEGANTLTHKKCCFYYFIQYHLHKQLKDAQAYANKKGIILKGDIPIGVTRFGVETWTEPALFNLDMQAGAPPDDFAEKGQNWGFPTYNWEAMKHNGYKWWRQRFQHLSQYFDAIRIDHILGFFRIWSIPSNQIEGIMGRFVPAIPINNKEIEDLYSENEVSRFCMPYITNEILSELADEYAEEVKMFLEETSEGFFIFKAEYNTQKAIECHFNELRQTKKNVRLKTILFSLISNVILFKDDKDPEAFHFRFNMSSTLSFKYLDKSIKQKLTHLYNDYFYYRQDFLWKGEAMEKLPVLINSTDMLVCGEDLGFIPRCVPDVMQLLGLLSLEVQRMPKIPNHSFVQLSDVRYLSVVTPSTHDMSTIRGWWLENYNLSQEFYTNDLIRHGTAPKLMDTTIVRSILLQHLSSNAQWAVFQIQDILAIDEANWVENPDEERINIPEYSNHYWRYRMKDGFEELLKNNNLNNKLKFLIESSGRA